MNKAAKIAIIIVLVIIGSIVAIGLASSIYMLQTTEADRDTVFQQCMDDIGDASQCETEVQHLEFLNQRMGEPPE